MGWYAVTYIIIISCIIIFCICVRLAFYDHDDDDNEDGLPTLCFFLVSRRQYHEKKLVFFFKKESGDRTTRFGRSVCVSRKNSVIIDTRYHISYVSLYGVLILCFSMFFIIFCKIMWEKILIMVSNLPHLFQCYQCCMCVQPNTDHIYGVFKKLNWISHIVTIAATVSGPS